MELVPDPAGVGRFGVARHGVPGHRHNQLIIFEVLDTELLDSDIIN